MRISPAKDIIPVELFVVERQDIDDIILILSPTPTNLLNHDVLNRRHPHLQINFRHVCTDTAID